MLLSFELLQQPSSCGVCPVGQAIAVQVRGARAPSGNHRPNRNIANMAEGQQLMAGGKFEILLENPGDQITMPHADSALRELGSSGTNVDLSKMPGALARGRRAARTAVAGPGAAGAPQGSGS